MEPREGKWKLPHERRRLHGRQTASTLQHVETLQKPPARYGESTLGGHGREVRLTWLRPAGRSVKWGPPALSGPLGGHQPMRLPAELLPKCSAASETKGLKF